MAEVKWIKICTDIFDDEKILLIEGLPSADSIIVIWFKLLTLAGKKNNGGVFTITESMPYTDEMFATIFRRDVNVVRLALETFKRFGMIDIIDNTVTIPKWNEHQNLENLNSRKEYMKNYMAKKRAEKKALAASQANFVTNVTQNSENGVKNTDVNANVNANVNINSEVNVNSCKCCVSSLDKIREDKRRIDYHPPLPPLVNNSAVNAEVVGDDDDENSDLSLSEIYRTWEKNLGTISPLFAEKLHALFDEVGYAATMHGVKTAILNNRRNIGYVEACAKNFVNGIDIAPKKSSTQMTIDESVAKAKEALERMRREDCE